MDASDWPVEELRSYLQFQIGLDEGEVRLMNEASVRALVLSLNPVVDDDPLPSIDPVVWPSRTDPPTSTRPAVNDAAAQSSSIHSDEISRDQMLSSFCEITSSSEVVALELLEACAWNFDTALAMHMDGVDSVVTSSSSSQPQPAMFDQSMQPPPLRMPMASSTERSARRSSGGRRSGRAAHDPFMEYEEMMNAQMREMRQHMGGAGGLGPLGGVFPAPMMHGFEGRWRADEDEEMETSTGHYDELEHGVRRPDPTRRAQLLGGGGGNDFSRADDPSVEWMFPPPRHLSFPGSFQEARALAKSDKKWVLVNIQAHTEFDSQKLNRDTWVDETVVEIIRENMLFWQRGHTSADARTYMGLYNITDADLPHIGIIDPRTGSKTSTIKGYVEPRVLTQTLFEFFDENSFDSTRAARERDRSVSSTSAPIVIDDEDEEDAATYLQAYEQSKIARLDADSTDSREAKKARDDSRADSKADVKEEHAVVNQEQARVDYGPVPAEPAAGSDGVRISIKLADGKALVRRYLKSDPVRSLFAVTSEAVGTAATRGFDLFTNFPKVALSAKLDDSVEAANLGGSQVAMQWL